MAQYSIAIALPLALALAVAPGSAGADIYSWVDASGVMNFSDTAPTRGARLLSVVHDTPARPVSAVEFEARRYAAQQAAIEAMLEHIRRLEAEVKQASIPPPQPQVQYVAAPLPSVACDPQWSDCSAIWSPQFVTGPLVVMRASHAHHRMGGERQIGNHSGPHRGNSRHDR